MKHKWIYLVLLFAVALLLIWGLSETSGSDHYDYQGYVVAVETINGDTVITTISGNSLSAFKVKWYTRQKFQGGITALKEGSFIRLSTTAGSDTNLKKFSAYEGYSMEGKLVYLNEVDGPFLLTSNDSKTTFRLYSLISARDNITYAEIGSTVKVYYQYPLTGANVTIVVDVVEVTSDIIEEFTEAEIGYIAAQGYTVKS